MTDGEATADEETSPPSEDERFDLTLSNGGLHTPRKSVAGNSDDPARSSLVLGGDYDDVGSIDLLLRAGNMNVTDPSTGRTPNIQFTLKNAVVVGHDDWQDGEYEEGEEVTGITIHTEAGEYHRDFPR